MFNKLLNELNEQKKIITFEKAGFANTKEGDLIEYTGVLSENPFVSQINALSGLLSLVEITNPEMFKIKQAKKGEPKQTNEMQLAKNLISHFAFSDDTSKHKLVVSKSKNHDEDAAFLVEKQFLRGRTTKDLAGGNYTVLGKVIRKHTGAFDLLNSTSLSLADSSITDGLLSGIGMENVDGFTQKPLNRYLENNVLEIFPIAIYI